MDILKSPSKSLDIPGPQNKGRRSFMWRMSAALSAALAYAVPGKASPGAEQDRVQRLSNQLAMLEDEKAILRLHRRYEDCLHNGRYEEVPDLFTDDGEVVFNGGIFQGKSGGVRRLYKECFQPCRSGRKIEPAPGFQPDAEQQQDSIKVAQDRKSAGARFPYSIQVGTLMNSDSQLVQMARLHGEGIMKWWEGGTCEVAYVKSTGDAGWKIKRLEYRTRSRANYRPGKSRARPISVPLLSEVYPRDPAGPDKLIDHA